MKHYRAFRDLLEQKGLEYSFNTDTEMYDIYRDRWHGPPSSQCFVVSVPAQVARRNLAEAHDLIRTALELEILFGS